MPQYEYMTADGEVFTRLFKLKERPSEIITADGRVAKFIISKPARLTRGWSSFGLYGTGVYNKTLGQFITSDKEHDDLCRERGLNRITDVRDFDKLDSQRSTRDAILKTEDAKHKRYEAALAETKDPIIANDIVYGAEEHEIAKKANDSIFEKYPAARAAVERGLI